MSWPANDRYWDDCLEFLRRHVAPTEAVVAPVEFEVMLDARVCDEALFGLTEVDWVVVHKGRVDAMDPAALQEFAARWDPVFANEVFVVLSRRGTLPRVPSGSPHVQSFREAVAAAARKAGARSDTFDWRWHTKEGARQPVGALSRPAVYLGDHRVLTRTIYGDKLLVDSRDIDLAPHLILDGYWEKWVTQNFLRLLANGMTVVEVGANVGYYSLLAARCIGPKGRLYCFEANPELAELLRSNLEINGYGDRAEVINKAVYSKSAKVAFHCFQKHRGGSSIWVDEKQVREIRDDIKTIEVDAIALDEFFVPGVRIDVLKIDAEGAEPHILEGARRLLSESQNLKVIMEVNGGQLQRALWHEDPCGVLWRMVQDMGFTMDLINHDGSLERASLERLRALKVSDVLLTR